MAQDAGRPPWSTSPSFPLAVAYKLAEVGGGKEVYLAIRRELARASAGP